MTLNWGRSGHTSRWLHRAKIEGHRLIRMLRDGRAVTRWPQVARTRDRGEVLAQVRAPLWQDTSPEEWALEAGKVHNVRLAIRYLRDVEVNAGEVFSFWRQVGRPSEARGFVEGREVRAGCVIPTVAGGICLISNALHRAALQGGLEVVERHGHTRDVQDDGPFDTDATVFWNYVDLRLRGPFRWRLEAHLDDRELVLTVRNLEKRDKRLARVSPERGGGATRRSREVVRSCLSCAETSCHMSRTPTRTTARRAWVLDGVELAFDAWLRARRGQEDLVIVPVDGERRQTPRYAWSLEGAEVIEFPALAMLRSATSRTLLIPRSHRAAQQRMDQTYAAYVADVLPAAVTELVVPVHLLGHLWRLGALGGRRYEVMLTRPPLSLIHTQLERAAARWPQEPSLRDFRAPEDLVASEEQALHGASAIHSAVKGYTRGLLGPVQMLTCGPQAVETDLINRDLSGGGLCSFPYAPMARLGALEVREALRGLPVRLLTPSGSASDDDFWRAADVRLSHEHRERPTLMMSPSWVSHSPKAVLKALAEGTQVITSEVYGLPPHPRMRQVPLGDVLALRRAVIACLDR